MRKAQPTKYSLASEAFARYVPEHSACQYGVKNTAPKLFGQWFSTFFQNFRIFLFSAFAKNCLSCSLFFQTIFYIYLSLNIMCRKTSRSYFFFSPLFFCREVFCLFLDSPFLKIFFLFWTSPHGCPTPPARLASMRKIFDIFKHWAAKHSRTKVIATLGSIQIIQLETGYYQAHGGTPEERSILRNYLAINLDDASFSNQTKKLRLLLQSL